MGIRHAREDGRPNDPAHPELIGPEDWDAKHVGSERLVDPGNVWAADTTVELGYQIAATLRGELEVFEVTVAGTTDADPAQGPADPNADTNYWDFFGGFTSDGSAEWRHLGRVDWMPLSGPLPQGWRLDDGALWIASTAPAVSGGDSQFVRWSRTRDDGSIEDIYTVNSDGDADYFILEPGSSVFWHGVNSQTLFRIRGDGEVSIAGPTNIPGIQGDVIAGNAAERTLGFFRQPVVQQGMDRPSGDAGALWDVLHTYGLVVPLAPVNLSAPLLFAIGFRILRATLGSWEGFPLPLTFGYQWQLSDDGVSGWTDLDTTQDYDYSPYSGSGKFLRCVVTASNVNGSGDGLSDSQHLI